MGVVGRWRWVDYLETAEDPRGVVFRVRRMATVEDRKRALGGVYPILEEVTSDRDLHASERAGELVARRSLQRHSDTAVDPDNGAEGSLWLLQSEAGHQDRAVLISWGC